MSDPVGAFGGGPFGDAAWGGGAADFYGGKLKCSPVVAGTVSITNGTGTVTDDGEGGFQGDGVGTIDYRTGAFQITMVPGIAGTKITADYLPAEGGCSDLGCGACKTHRFRLIVKPGTIAGQGQVTITDAFKRLVAKVAKMTPIHAVWQPILISDVVDVPVVAHYDLTAADVQETDTNGLRVEAE